MPKRTVQKRDKPRTSSPERQSDHLGDPLSASEIASQGTRGGGGSLPHLDRIQSSFGHHDVTGVSSHTGASAQSASDALGASAFASGNSVGFDSVTPSLHTSAHEATHVVQQRSGVQLKAETGEVGDRYERHADAVADVVVSGGNAAPLLDQMASPEASGGTTAVQSKAVQLEEKPLPKKEVSSKAMGRLSNAKSAIKATKKDLSHGAGNIRADILKSNMNSRTRLLLNRDKRFWEFTTAAARAAARRSPVALGIAKTMQSQGGNCGEHAWLGYYHLQQLGQGDLNRVSHSMDHGFVVIGDLGKDTDADLVACDPWPTAPTACLWEDHLGYSPDQSQITVRGGGDEVAAMVPIIQAGLTLTDAGKRLLTRKESDQKTQDFLGTASGLWNNETSHAPGKGYDYVEKDSVQQQAGPVQMEVSAGDRVKAGLKGALSGFFKNIFFGWHIAAWADQINNMRALDKNKEANAVYAQIGEGMRVYDMVKETVQMVANVATGVSVVLGILSIFMPPVAVGATIAGIVATAAHGLALVMRLGSLLKVRSALKTLNKLPLGDDAAALALRNYRR